MDITNDNIRGLFNGFNTSFNKGVVMAPSQWAKVAMKVPSSTSSNTYAWLGDMPGIRKWLGDRVVHELTGSKYRIENELFEETVSVRRTQIEDDEYGIFGPMVEKMGFDTAMHPDTLVFDLLAKGTTTLCYDGQYFFSEDHPVGIGATRHTVSNFKNGGNAAVPAWYLIDASQPVKPLIYQERLRFKPTQLTDDGDELVFMKDQYLYGVRGRSNAGFGLWQMAYCLSVPLSPDNFATARAEMAKFHNDAGMPLGVRPTHVIVPPELEAPARRLLNGEMAAGGESNIWAKTAEVIVSPYLNRWKPAAV